ncbi:hypothetical protein Acr_08g0009890 [Actinidia rufa]|uniref:NAD(P)-binding Rossmann-fold superfamily protein n=1 Tax=Actinidia rufa TaxID=165716 RepID=A0A7J0F1W7_9ERIC|nr:hypothetical protein Acr_08g0009890 [Actinidia rufa]
MRKRVLRLLKNSKALVFLSMLVFHHLDEVEPSCVASLASFIKNQFGKLDIQVNNAAITGVIMDRDAIKASAIDVKGVKIKLDTTWQRTA